MGKRKILILAGCLCLVGALVAGAGFAMMNFNVRELSRTAGNYKQMSKDVKNINSKKDIKLEFSHHDIYVVPSIDEDLHITYYDKKDHPEYTIVENNDMFAIRYKEAREATFDMFFNFSIYEEDHSVELQIPKDYKGNLDLNTTYGQVEIKGFEEIGNVNIATTHENVTLQNMKTANNLDVTTTHGRVDVKDLKVGQFFDISATHGDITMQAIKAQELEVRTTYGEINARDVQSDKDIQLRSTHENIVMDNVRSNARMDVNTTYGRLRFDDVDAKELRLETTHESIDGNLNGALQDYQISYSVSHGESNVTDTNKGNKKLYLKTTYGDIDVSFAS